MKKYISLSIFSIVVIGIFAFTGVSSSNANFGQNCPSYYQPVCGETASGKKAVFQNLCTMNASGSTFVQWNSCENKNNYFSGKHYQADYINSWQYETPQYQNTYPSVKIIQYGWNQEYIKGGIDSNGCVQQGDCKTKTPVCISYSNPSCEYGYKLVDQGYLSNGCKKQSLCEKVVYSQPAYTETFSRNSYLKEYINPQYIPSYVSGRKYSQTTQVKDFRNPIQNHSFIEISRNKDSRSNYVIAQGNEFTITLLPQDSYGIITHTIPAGVKLVNILKGNCSISSELGEYGNTTKLSCFNSEVVQYTVRAVSESECNKNFTTIFEGRNYSPVWKNLSITIQ